MEQLVRRGLDGAAVVFGNETSGLCRTDLDRCDLAVRVPTDPEYPVLSRQTQDLLEVLKDMFYQCFVRRGKLTRAIKVRRFFVQDGNGGVQSSA